MNAAQKLRQEMEGGAPFTKDEFIKVVSDSIKKNGRYSFITDYRSEVGSIKTGSIPTKYFELVLKWVREEGFTVTTFHNYYGVTEYDITL